MAVTGGGTLDGGADCQHWWPWKGRTNCGWKTGDPSQQKARDALLAAAERDVPPEKPIFGDGSFLRPNFVQFYNCEDVLIEGVTIVNSPMWEIHPVLCRNVTVRDVKVSSHGPNHDGSNPESCRDVLIEGCLFDTGDDCIALKSGRNREGIHCRNIHVGQVSGAVVEVDFHYEEGAGGPHLRVSPESTCAESRAGRADGCSHCGATRRLPYATSRSKTARSKMPPGQT